jgi:hypothetical protein
MRQNIRLTSDQLMLAKTAVSLREVKEQPNCKQRPVTDADAEMAGYLMVFGVLLIVISLVLAFAP